MTQNQAELIWQCLAVDWMKDIDCLYNVYLEIQQLADSIDAAKIDVNNDKNIIETFFSKYKAYCALSDAMLNQKSSQKKPFQFKTDIHFPSFGVLTAALVSNDFYQSLKASTIYDPFVLLLPFGFFTRMYAIDAFKKGADNFISLDAVCLKYADAKEMQLYDMFMKLENACTYSDEDNYFIISAEHMKMFSDEFFLVASNYMAVRNKAYKLSEIKFEGEYGMSRTE